MKSLHFFLITTLVAITLPDWVHASLPGVRYEFTRVAQTLPGEISGFHTFALNSTGQVAYTVFHPNESQSVYRWTAGQTVRLATEGDSYQGQPISVPGRMDLNDAGTVAFVTRRFAGHQTGETGIFRTDGSGFTKLAPLQPQSIYFIDWLNLNNDGSVTYPVQVGGSSTIVARSDGQSIQTIYSNGSWIPMFPRVNTTGDVVFDAFSGQASRPYQGVLVRNGIVTTFADTLPSSNPRFDSVGGANINNPGEVVFIGQLHQGPRTLFSFQDGQLTQLIDPSLSAFGGVDGLPGINDAGQLVFFGYLDNGQSGIFTGLDPLSDALITTGQSLDSKIVANVATYGDINNAGQVVFQSTFTDGSVGLYLASPVPEPESMLLVAIVAATATLRCLRPERRWLVGRRRITRTEG